MKIRKACFAVLALAVLAATQPALAIGVRIDPDGAASIGGIGALFALAAALTGGDNTDRGWGIDPNG